MEGKIGIASPGVGRAGRSGRRLKLATDMQHVEAVLKMFDPVYNVRAIAARSGSGIGRRSFVGDLVGAESRLFQFDFHCFTTLNGRVDPLTKCWNRLLRWSDRIEQVISVF
jgi:hypothetical protein